MLGFPRADSTGAGRIWVQLNWKWARGAISLGTEHEDRQTSRGRPRAEAKDSLGRKTTPCSRLCPSHWVMLGQSLASLASVSPSVE